MPFIPPAKLGGILPYFDKFMTHYTSNEFGVQSSEQEQNLFETPNSQLKLKFQIPNDKSQISSKLQIPMTKTILFVVLNFLRTPNAELLTCFYSYSSSFSTRMKIVFPKMTWSRSISLRARWRFSSLASWVIITMGTAPLIFLPF